MKPQIIPSIIAKNQAELNKRLSKIINLSSIIQLDIMDGKFVKNKSLWFDFKLPHKPRKTYEAHLMVKEPLIWVNDKKNIKQVNTVIFHIESIGYPDEIISLIKSKHKKVGIALNPSTPVNKVKPYLSKISQITTLAVNPGKYGSRFLPSVLNKVKQLRKLKPNLNIEVDGGLGDKHLKEAKKAGANMFISGGYLQNTKNSREAYGKLKRLIV